MILSRSSEYAIRAFLYLAEQEPGKLIMARHIAEEAELPGHFLAKLLQQLARKGLVRSNKGPSGGFALGRPPREISLFSIVEAVEGVENLDRRASREPATTNAHHDRTYDDGWRTVHSRIVDYLEHTSLADVLKTNPAADKKRLNSRVKVNGSK
jgi:Rrf2 family iron-sulfur cluster assembly transcriptional regulator